MSTVEDNKEMVRRYFEEGLNNVDMTVIQDSLASEYIGYWATGEAVKRNEAEAVIKSTNKAFPDLHYTIETIVSDEDFVSTRVRVTATHKGEIMGIQPTGRVYTWEEAIFSRLQNGKISEEWQYLTSPSLFEQMKQNTSNN
jgi:predicted ester cyclase